MSEGKEPYYGSTSLDEPAPPTKKKLPLPAVGMLVAYTIINLLSYFDRGALSGSLEDIQDDLSISNTLQGLLGSAFMIGYMIGSPIFAHMVTVFEPFRVMAVGLIVWSAATAVCGLSGFYVPLLFGRILTGFGEAGFLCIAPPFIDKFAPPAKKSLWLSVFYAAIPIGYALGFFFSGVILDAQPFGPKWSWRVIFLGEACLMVPFILFCFLGSSPYSFAGTSGTDSNSQPIEANEDDLLISSSDGHQIIEDEESVALSLQATSSSALVEHRYDHPFLQRVYCIFSNPLYLSLVFGYAAQTFVTGGFAFYGINYVKEVLDMSKSGAGVVFGLVTIIAGFGGTLTGGVILDRWRRSAEIPSSLHKPTLQEGDDAVYDVNHLGTTNDDEGGVLLPLTPEEQQLEKQREDQARNDLHNPNNIKDRLHSIQLAYRLIILSTLVSIPFALLSFLVSHPALFAVFIFIAEFALFLCFSPLNNIIMWSVNFNLTPQAIALSVVVVHLLGDSLSPFFIGLMLSLTDQKYRLVMFLCCVPLSIAILCWAVGSGVVNAYLNTIKDYKYVNNPLFVTDSNTTESYQGFTMQQISSVRPFASIRRNLLWDLGEQCK